jgi:hypothetical protein
MVVVLTAGASARAAEDPLARFASEPSVATLQRAAAALADVEPERARSWLRRVRKAGLLPGLKVRVGRGMGGVQIVHGLDGIDQYVSTASDTWRFEIEADWALDRLLFDRNELRVSREAQRLAARREQLLNEVAQLYFARRRLQVDALVDPNASAEVTLDRRLQIEELTAILDGLTGGALSRGRP